MSPPAAVSVSSGMSGRSHATGRVAVGVGHRHGRFAFASCTINSPECDQPRFKLVAEQSRARQSADSGGLRMRRQDGFPLAIKRASEVASPGPWRRQRDFPGPGQYWEKIDGGCSPEADVIAMKSGWRSPTWLKGLIGGGVGIGLLDPGFSPLSLDAIPAMACASPTALR